MPTGHMAIQDETVNVPTRRVATQTERVMLPTALGSFMRHSRLDLHAEILSVLEDDTGPL